MEEIAIKSCYDFMKLSQVNLRDLITERFIRRRAKIPIRPVETGFPLSYDLDRQDVHCVLTNSG